jgi:uncharacterized membrane protein
VTWQYPLLDWVTVLGLSVSSDPTDRTVPQGHKDRADVQILGLAAHIIETFAVQRVSGMHAALMGYSQVGHVSLSDQSHSSLQIPFAAIVQFVFTATLPSTLTILGSAIIIAAGVWSIVSHTCDVIA